MKGIPWDVVSMVCLPAADCSSRLHDDAGRLFQLAFFGHGSTAVPHRRVEETRGRAWPSDKDQYQQRSFFPSRLHNSKTLNWGRTPGEPWECSCSCSRYQSFPCVNGRTPLGKRRTEASEVVLDTCKLLGRRCCAPHRPREHSSWIGSACSRPSTVARLPGADAVVALLSCGSSQPPALKNGFTRSRAIQRRRLTVAGD